MDEAGAFTFGYATDDDGNPRLGDGSEADPLLVGLATKASVQALSHASTWILHVDATYKTNTCGFPVLVIGISDAWRQFHPVALFIASDARHTQYEAALSSLLTLYTVVTGDVAQVKYVMADADNAQRNEFEAVLGNTVPASHPDYLICFCHVMKVKKYTAGMSVASRRLAYRHVYRIHYARTQVDLDARIEEALTAWGGDAECIIFHTRFETQWLFGRYTKWYCIATPAGFAKTNNPVEQFNRAFKREYTLRTFVSLNTLFGSLLSAANNYTVRAKPSKTTPRPTADEIKRYTKLQEEGRLLVWLAYRSAVAFLLDDAVHAHVFRVIQTGWDRPRALPQSNRAEDFIHAAEVAIAEEAIETMEQPSVGWTVDVDNMRCGCRTLIKNGWCVHLLACMVHMNIKDLC